MKPQTSRVTATLVMAVLCGSVPLRAQSPPPAGESAPALRPGSGQVQEQASGALAQDATQAGTLFPVWHLQSNRNIDPRVRPNAGLRTPMAYSPIAGGPMFYPTFSPVAPDFLGVQATTPWSVRGSLALFGVEDQRVSSKL